jgi:CheY-like chemotaxis protein
MDERTIARAFEPFFTSDPTRGAGLGLWVSRQLVESFGGTLVLKSTVGVGTAAELSLQAVKTESHRPSDANIAVRSVPPARPRVLVIDDEPLIGRALKRSLPEYEVVYEERASCAIARVRDGEEFDAVLCDLTMPGTDGLSVLQSIANLAPELHDRMALMTGGASDAALQEIAFRKLTVIDKPFAPDTLASTLRVLSRNGVEDDDPREKKS